MTSAPTVLITGAAARLGREMALSLCAQGWDVALHYNRSAQAAQELAGDIERMGRKAFPVAADLRDTEAVAGLIPSLERQGVALNCVIHNAAAFEKDTLADFTPEQFQLHMQTNLLAPMLLNREFARHYNGDAGNIIHITDGLLGWSMSGAFLSYALSKQSLAYATKLLADELAPRIRVNAIAPGATLEGKQDKHDTFAKLKSKIPLSRASSPEELIKTIDYILSSPSLTGQQLFLSGGMHLCRKKNL